MQRRFALLAEAGDGDGGGDGASTGGSPEGGQDGKPKDGELVPKTQFIAALNSAERKRQSESAALQARIDALEAQVKAKPAEAPKRYTRAQLSAAVAAGEITQEQADAHIEQQIREDANAGAERVALNTITAVERKKQVDSEIARYTAVAPEILDDDHDTRKDIKRAFNELVALGDSPKDVATQVKAIRQVLGPIDRLEKSRSGRSQHEHHRETGGGGGGGGGERQKTGKLSDQLNAEGRKHYEKGIEQGRYKDWAAVDDELKYAKPATRQRLGIAA